MGGGRILGGGRLAGMAQPFAPAEVRDTLLAKMTVGEIRDSPMAEFMDINQMRARFSLAYISAVASQAGVKVDEVNVDDDSVDGVLSARFGRRPKIEFQAKASARNLARNGGVHFPLSVKNYEDLRLEAINPRILIVLLMPDAPDDWITQTDDALCMRRCAYWMSILGSPETSNDDSVTVRLPMTNMFDKDSLIEMMLNTERRGAI